MDSHEVHERRPGEALFGLIFLAASVFLLWQSYQIAGFEALSSPGAFPMAASATMVVASLIVVIGDMRKRREQDGDPILPMTVAIFIGLVLAYAVALAPLGFIPSTFLFLAIGTKLLYRSGWPATLGLALASVIVIYVIFRIVFQVVLPEGIFPEGEMMAAIEGLFATEEAE